MFFFKGDARVKATTIHMRPDCHKEGTSYGAVYGRMRWDAPAPTLTTGFLTTGRGRFIHPKRPRTITPREAARLQGFPDWFDFIGTEMPARRDLAKWIGNAVPTVLGYLAGLAALSGRAGPSD
jgi:DNA (cytosine-5)-methyltransferase 1